jgi:hypothetical protein
MRMHEIPANGEATDSGAPTTGLSRKPPTYRTEQRQPGPRSISFALVRDEQRRPSRSAGVRSHVQLRDGGVLLSLGPLRGSGRGMQDKLEGANRMRPLRVIAGGTRRYSGLLKRPALGGSVGIRSSMLENEGHIPDAGTRLPE